MAYNQSNNSSNRSNNQAQAPRVQYNASSKSDTGGKFEPDPLDVGIGYEKEMKSGGRYISVTVTKDIKAGTKIAVFSNDKVKNRTEKTPTHKLKLSVKKSA